jgi:fumarylacetoacetate (FAA) hydrolase
MIFGTILNKNNQERLVLVVDNKFADLENESKKMNLNLPSNMADFLLLEEKGMDLATKVKDNLKNGFDPVEAIKILSPVPKPTSCRDGYAFQQHVEAARRNRGVEMIEEFYQYPIFYFTNHNAVFGEGDVLVEKDHLEKLDFELEWAAVIGKKGRNISSSQADNFIAGFTIMNDFSARLLQMEEMKLNLGPAKGKDFATTIGPFLYTPDELESKRIPSEFGNHYDLSMKAFHNGKQVSEGNTKDMTFTFAEIIERVSYGIDVFPGDVIGSGTVGTGCYLELNGTWAREAKEKSEEFTPVWLNDNDIIELEIDILGKLSNKIVLTNNNISILEKKKFNN